MSRSLLTFALLGWALLLAGAGPVSADPADAAPDGPPVASVDPGGTGDDGPDGLAATADARPELDTASDLPTGPCRSVRSGRRPATGHPPRGPPHLRIA